MMKPLAATFAMRSIGSRHLALALALLLAPRDGSAQEPPWQPQTTDELVRLARGRAHADRLLRDIVWPYLQQQSAGDTVWVIAEQWPHEWLPPSPPVFVRLPDAEWRARAANNRSVHHLTFEQAGADTLWVGVGATRRCGGSTVWSAWVWSGEEWRHGFAGRGSSSGLSHCP